MFFLVDMGVILVLVILTSVCNQNVRKQPFLKQFTMGTEEFFADFFLNFAYTLHKILPLV